MFVRRVVVSAVSGVVAVGAVTVALAGLPSEQPKPGRCGTGSQLSWALPGACEHIDAPPPGVDVTRAVATSTLRAREGAGPAAYEAAETLGVPAATAAAAASSSVPCDGDGTSGYRTQAMYVVESGRTNRFSSVVGSIRQWAAGVDDVVNRSAALTGGVRHVRYVTDTDGSTCTANVLNVTVPAGSMATFNATISAVQALGYTATNRKYLMWTDATVLCGIASMYPVDTESQSNPNNGSYAQYARVDSGCWGFGDGATQHSVEAHELLHTLGGVQSTAPHGTRAGHCWDESDTMCYADGGGFAMKQVCPPEREYLLDCNNDDYFSTYPDPGSWLDGHWNAADSRFLIGGGDGSGGGSAGAPTVLGATISVNNPAVPGLGTQAAVAPSLPAGRTVSRVSWASARKDCVFTTPTSQQTEVVCDATASGSTTVTATVTDSTGATKTVTSPLTFATGSPRAVTVALSAAGQSPASGETAKVCTGTPFPLAAQVVDTASGRPVKGLATALTKQVGTATAAAAGAPLTGLNGTATLSATATATTTYTARTTAGAVYAAASPVSVVAAPGLCSTALTASTDPGDGGSIYTGDPVTLSGALTAAQGGTTITPAGIALTARLVTATGSTVTLGTTKTAADGTFSMTVRPTASGSVRVALAASAGYTAATATAGQLTVVDPATRLTAAASASDVGYGQTVRVTGTLTRDAGGTVTPLVTKPVSVLVTPSGGSAVKVGAGNTNGEGAFTIDVPLKLSGTLSVAFAGLTGQPAAKVDIGSVTAGTWTTAVTASSSTSTYAAGTAATLSGSVSRTYGGATSPAPSMRLRVLFTATGTTTPVQVGTASTSVAGVFSVRVSPRSAGTWRIELPTAPGYASSSSSDLAIN